MCGGGGGPVSNFVSDVVQGAGDLISGAGNAVSDLVSGAGDALASIDPGPAIGDAFASIDPGPLISDAGVAIDQAVNDIIPGGWGTVGAAALAAATYGGSLAAEGALEAGTLAAEEIGAEAAAEAAAENIASEAATSAATEAAADTAANVAAETVADVAPEVVTDAATEIAPEAANYAGDAAYEAQGLQEGYQSAANPLGDVTNPDGSITSTFDDGSTITRMGDEIVNTTEAIADPLTFKDLKTAYDAYKIAKTGYGLFNALTGGAGGNLRTLSPLTRATSLSSTLGGAPTSAGSSSGALPGNLEATSLAAAPVTQGYDMNFNQLKQLYPQLSTIDPKLLQTLMGKAAATSAMGESGGGGATGLSMAGQGGTPQAGYPSIATDKNAAAATTKFAGTPLSGKFDALAEAGLANLGGSRNPYGLKDGGQPHIPQFRTGTTGHYVQGEGDGQSDDIPAMLADGEYVFDADTVAALGNGSNKAGALQLDKMRQEIRKHKRSAPHNKIPPKAKSPLEYLKGK